MIVGGVMMSGPLLYVSLALAQTYAPRASVLAVVGAVAMIVGAMVVRGRLDDRDDDAGQVYRLVCAADLGQVCADLDDAFPGRVDVTVEGAGATADRLRRLDGDPELDGWLVADPWPALVDEARRAGSLPPLFDTPAPPLARSPLVIVAWKDRAGALAPTCPGGKVGWKCLGDAAGRPDAKVGHADAARDGTGLLVLAQATVEWFDGRTDLSTFDLEDEGFQRWFAAPRAADGAGRQLAPRPDAPASGGPSTTSSAPPRPTRPRSTPPPDGTSSPRSTLRPWRPPTWSWPSPPATGGIACARSSPAGPATELTDAGWKAPGSAGLPAGNGLPDAGLIDAIRAKAREVTGR